MYGKTFFSGLFERAVSTFAQVIVGAIGVAVANGAGILARATWLADECCQQGD